jgi:hypothetical protein
MNDLPTLYHQGQKLASANMAIKNGVQDIYGADGLVLGLLGRPK